MAQTDRDQASGNRRDAFPPPRQHRPSMVAVMLLLVALVLVLDGVAGERGWLANRRAAAQYGLAERALSEARARNAVLREEVRRLKNDPAAIEEAARRQLMLMKPGEKVFIVRDQRKIEKK